MTAQIIIVSMICRKKDDGRIYAQTGSHIIRGEMTSEEIQKAVMSELVALKESGDAPISHSVLLGRTP